MKRIACTSHRVVVLIAAMLCVSCQATWGSQPAETSSSTGQRAVAGQTRTLLPNGDWLLLGGSGVGGEMLRAASVQDKSTGTLHVLPTELQLARAWHSATVLPNGDVLVLGGIGNDGKVVATPEVFHSDSLTFGGLIVPAPMARAFHTATLLTDGRVFVAGGASMSGRVLDTIEVWDPRQKVGDVLYSALNTGRRNHGAALLSDGRVLLSGGKDAKDAPVVVDEMFDPESGKVSRVDGGSGVPAVAGAEGAVQGSLPSDNAQEVPIDAIIGLRFSQYVDPGSVTKANVSLEGSGVNADAKLTTAEGGKLVFLIPAQALVPGSIYKVVVSGVVTASGQPVPFWQFSFSTAGVAGDDEDWIPDASNGWRTGRGQSPWQSLPPLQAPPGVTALAGQALKLNGQPLANVSLNIGLKKTHTDNTGRFLLAEVDGGHQVMFINGHPAARGNKDYGTFEDGVDLVAGKTTALKYTIWMTALDHVHAVRIPSPTVSETIITNPLLPNLEFRIPANTVIKDHDGNPVHEVSITPIPLDRPTFPLPQGVIVPIYFTIQPGAGYVEVRAKSGPKGGRLIYPNAFRQRPGAILDFYDYNPDVPNGWFVYGKGKVTDNAKQIEPLPGVVVYELTGAMVSSQGYGPGTGPRHPIPTGGDPVDLGTGLFVYSHTDMVVRDVIPIVLSRTYRQNDYLSRAFGVGTSHPYDMFLTGNACAFPAPGCYTVADLYLADGSAVHFQRISSGYSYSDAVFQNTTTPGPFYNAKFSWNQASWVMTLKDGTKLGFPDSENATGPQQAGLTGIADRFGNSLLINRNGSNGQISQITTQNGRWVQFTYDSNNRITQAQDNIGRTVSYTYDGTTGVLLQVTDANGGVTKYTYDPYNEMTSIQDARGIDYITNQYGSGGLVVKQTLADGGTYQFNYITSTTTASAITETDLTDPLGNVEKVVFNANRFRQSDTRAFGKPEQQITTYGYDPTTNLLQNVTDPIGRVTSYAYDGVGNIQTVTEMYGTPAAATTSFSYDPNFNQVSSVTDPFQNQTILQVDPVTGLVDSIKDSLQHSTSFTFTSAGKLLTTTDALQNVTTLGYDSGDLTSKTDPLGFQSVTFYDSIGRIVAFSDAQGHTRKIQYDGLDQTVQATDARQENTSFTHDPNGNVLSISDANHNSTTYSYDNMDRVVKVTDPLGRSDTYQYDLAGNLSSHYDRRGKLATLVYDGLNRITAAKFGVLPGPTSESFVNFTYDGVSRIIGLSTESSQRNITRTYDDLHRTISETTALGTTTVGIDAGHRRSSFVVSGQPAVTYSYDNASRLTQIAQGSTTVVLGYDNANRRTSVTLPSGIIAQYGYDNASNLTGISYGLGSTVLGTLGYTIDSTRHISQVTGSLARTTLPEPALNASYDAANAILQWGSTPFSYDPDGNLISDGANAFIWNAENRLASINGAALLYDADGRRIQNLQGTQFLYDGKTVVQELTNALPTANRLIGVSPDEFFLRSDTSGSKSPFIDGIGSTVALADATGAIQTQYTYEPFGNTQSTGLASPNAFEYTGRENDGSGVYYYRARYYSTNTGRFLSQDPIGFGGGINVYAYAGNNPISTVDSFGLSPTGNGIPDCGADCVLSPQERQAVNQAMAVRDQQLADLEGPDAEPAPTSSAGRKTPPQHDDTLQQKCIQTANLNFVSNLHDIGEGTKPELTSVLGIHTPGELIPPELEIWDTLKHQLPVPIGEILLKHLGWGLLGEGASTVGPFLYYANRANSDYDTAIATCGNY